MIARAGLAALVVAVRGYPDATFRPGQPVTRGQLAAFVARALDLSPRLSA